MTLLNPDGSLLAIQRVYLSPSVGRLFPAQNFMDENGNQAQIGTIGVILNYNLESTSSFLECVVQVGLQQK